MKRYLAVLLILSFALCMSAQDNDSILLERTDMLKKEIGKLKKTSKSLQGQIYRLQKAQKAQNADLQGVKDEISAVTAEMEELNTAVGELEKALQESEESAVEGLAMLGDWTKKMFIILAIIACILIIILFIMVVTNRSRIQKDYLKLEAKVDNTREAVEKDVREALKKHEEDMVALKAHIDKSKK
jgi:septal ring factor EnvC (AmiA/AmiB activator)